MAPATMVEQDGIHFLFGDFDNQALAFYDKSATTFILQVDNASGALRDRINITTAKYTINADGDDMDLSWQGDTNANLFEIDAGLDSLGLGGVVVAGAFLTLKAAVTGRAFVTSVGVGVHAPAATYNDTAAAATIAIMPFVSILTQTFTGTNARTFTDAAIIYVAAGPVASTNITITRGYSVFADAGNVRFDANIQSNNTAAFGTTQPTNALIMNGDGTAPAGTLTNGSALYASTTALRKIIAAGTDSLVET